MAKDNLNKTKKRDQNFHSMKAYCSTKLPKVPERQEKVSLTNAYENDTVDIFMTHNDITFPVVVVSVLVLFYFIFYSDCPWPCCVKA